MLKRARCIHCEVELPLRPAARDFRLAPHSMACPGCERSIETIFLYRVGWMEGLLHKCFAIVSVPVCLYLAATGEGETLRRVLVATLGPLLVGGIVGFVFGKAFAFPATLIIDKVRGKK